jgi:hypothetical protein
MQARGITIILRSILGTPVSVRFNPKHVEWALPVALCIKKEVFGNLRYIAFVIDIILSVNLLIKLISNLHLMVILRNLFLFEPFNVDGLDFVILIIDLLWNTFLNHRATGMLCTVSAISSLVQLLSEGWGLPREGLMGFLCQVTNTLIKKLFKKN